jgi:AraC-like DNA-binding protein
MSTLALLLGDLLEPHLASSRSGSVDTDLPGVHLFWATEAVPRTPLLYSASIVIVAQGHKIGYLGDRRFRYDRETYLVLGVPIPFECETHASPDEPLLGTTVDVDVTRLHHLVASLGGSLHLDRRESAADPYAGVEPAHMDEAMIESTAKLLTCLRDPLDTKVLGSAAVEEVVYRVLRGEKGRVLYDLTQHSTPYADVARALRRMHRDYRESLSVDELARETAMSVSTFHRAFKRVTGDSPLQYLKKIRLDKARGMLVHQGMRVNSVAYEVGYESPSQFSREYKRYYKVSPSEAHALAYANVV